MKLGMLSLSLLVGVGSAAIYRTLETGVTSVGSCGGHYTQQSGEFTSPQYPSTYPNFAHCTWHIQSTGTKIIRLTFIQTDIEAGNDCRFDAIRIYDGPFTSNRLLGKLCGSQTGTFNSSGNDLTVVFSSDQSLVGQGFVAHWVFEGSCGGHYTQQSGEFTSPQYPSRYPNFADCSWRIQSTGTKIIRLTFIQTDIEASEGCRFDAISVYDGPSTSYRLLGRLCGSQTGTFNSSGNDLTVVFSSDQSFVGQGFVAHWVFFEGVGSCGGHYTQQSGEFTSPQYPSTYPNFAHCSWHIQSTGTKIIRLTFMQTDIEAGEDCRYDAIRIFDGPSTSFRLLGSLCGYQTGTFNSSGNDLTVVFSSDDDVVGQGFVARWIFEAQCGGDLTNSRGEFFSPQYPNNYPNNADCTWRLQAPEGKVVHLTFTFVNLEECCDFITLYDGPTHDHTRLGELPQDERNAFSSTRKYLTVVFSSDGSTTHQGFRAQWEFLDGTPCGGSLTESRGEFFSPQYPNNYPNNADCTWRLQALEGQVVKLTFTLIDLEDCCDSIRVYDGPTDTYPLLSRRDQDQTYLFNSTRNYLTVVFTSDHSNTHQGFGARWEFSGKVSCGEDLTNSSGEFFSPQYPNNYPNSAHCTWRLLALERQFVHLTFTFVDLEECCDYISVYDGPTDAHPRLGVLLQDRKYHFNSTRNYLTVVFTSDRSASRLGFRAQWEFSDGTPCGGSLTNSRGEFFSPQYPNNYPNNANCTWRLQALEGQVVHLTFTFVDLEECCDRVRVYDGPTDAYPLLQDQRYHYNSTRNYLTVVFTSDSSKTNQGFRAQWEFSAGASCGQDLINSSGEFFSPQYPNNYPNNAECTWRLLASEGKTVHLTFTFVDVEQCCDSINMYDGPTDAYPLLGQLPQMRNHFNSTRNYLTVVFSSDRSATRRGFRAQWAFSGAPPEEPSPESISSPPEPSTDTPTSTTAPCGGSLTNSRGEFFSPQYPNNYPNSADCTWRLQASERQIINLTFTFVDLERCCDSISVFDGPTDDHPLLGELPQDEKYAFNSTRNHLTVVFTSDRSTTRQGFRAQWEFSDREPCGGDLTNSRGELFSPHYPSNYPNDADCTWRLQASEGQVVNLTFTFIDLEECCDSISVYDGPTDAYRLLGELPRDERSAFISTGYYLTVVFTSDRSASHQGFRAQWEFSDRAPCGGDLTKSRGEFFSPQYPNKYPNNANCTWRLQASETQVVKLTFTFIDLEECCDFISVYDGPINAYPLLGHRDQDQRYHFNSTRNYLTVVFTSDESETNQGFRAQWEFSAAPEDTDVPPYFLKPSPESISSPPEPSTYTPTSITESSLQPSTGPPTPTSAPPSCRWNCGYNLGSCSCSSSCQYYGDCCRDYYDFCHGTATTPKDNADDEAPCGGDLTESRGEFFSPQYPKNYPNSADCKWRLQASEGQVVYLTFTLIDLEECCDSIRVFDGPDDDHPLLGGLPQDQKNDFSSSRNHLTVVFRSDSCVNLRGFRAQWEFSESSTVTPEPTTHSLTPTTAPPSCRNKCGYDLGSCSCTSSCQYSGNCCHDYYDYCYTNTPTPDAPTDRPSKPSDDPPDSSDDSPNSKPDPSFPKFPNIPMPPLFPPVPPLFPPVPPLFPPVPPLFPPVPPLFPPVPPLFPPVPPLFPPVPPLFPPVPPLFPPVPPLFPPVPPLIPSTKNYPPTSTSEPPFKAITSSTESSTDPPTHTSAPPSCRWNCGSNLGSCSCSSSCQDNGNCCRDYYDHCYTSTTSLPDHTTEPPFKAITIPTESSTDPPTHTSAPPSCRWNCGYNLGSCSCSSSCLYSGDCCADYYYFCHGTATTPKDKDEAPCGGDLTESRGEFFSPQYPNNYPNSADCTWRLQASEGQVVYLTFTLIDLEECCDSIRVYDGPDDAHPLLGGLPKDQSSGFNSSRNHLTVVFKSDSCVNLRGFRAQWEFSESTPEPSTVSPEPSTYPLPPTEAPPSCRWNCGYNLGSCSCSSSCLYSGDCCPDYYYFCHGTATTPKDKDEAPCGGDLTESRGEFFSPQYPKNYPNSADCKWRLQASEGQIVYLTFTLIDLEECCDSIRVYDGPDDDHPLLGRLPQDQKNDFSSSRNHLTVVFRSDSCVNLQGFRAQWEFSESSTVTPEPTTHSLTPTTAPPLCRNKCGYDLGSCSCTSSCQYSGNCCHDYYDYCYTNTPTPDAPTDRPPKPSDDPPDSKPDPSFPKFPNIPKPPLFPPLPPVVPPLPPVVPPLPPVVPPVPPVVPPVVPPLPPVVPPVPPVVPPAVPPVPPAVPPVPPGVPPVPPAVPPVPPAVPPVPPTVPPVPPGVPPVAPAAPPVPPAAPPVPPAAPPVPPGVPPVPPAVPPVPPAVPPVPPVVPPRPPVVPPGPPVIPSTTSYPPTPTLEPPFEPSSSSPEPSTDPPTHTSAPPSCRRNCGSNLGSCSCSSSCQYNGNCCRDYYDHCYTSTTSLPDRTTEPPYLAVTILTEASTDTSSPTSAAPEPSSSPPEPSTDPVTPTSAPPSCRWNCGSNLGSCSCSSSCQDNGNCCRDYYDHCYTSTTSLPDHTTEPPFKDITSSTESSTDPPTHTSEPPYQAITTLTEASSYPNSPTSAAPEPSSSPPEPSTDPATPSSAPPSCRWNCGSNLGSCSCSSSCQYNGNCCRDYYDHCYTSTTSLPDHTTEPPFKDITSPTESSTDPPTHTSEPLYQAITTLTEASSYPPSPTSAAPEPSSSPPEPSTDPVTPLSDSFTSTTSLPDHTTEASFEPSSSSPEPSTDHPSHTTGPPFQPSSSSTEHSNDPTTHTAEPPFEPSSSSPEPSTDPPSHTSVTLPNCGGHLFGSGSLSSPNYPNNYHNNAYCVWQLSAPAGQRIFLSFVDLQLERCCNCDYINVYDGSSSRSPLLDNLCFKNITNWNFRSSSSDLTVLFRSDGSGVARGFKGFFRSSLSENTGQYTRVVCSSDSMTVVIQRSYLDSLGISWQNLYVDDPRCRPSANSYEVSFSFPFDMCGTSNTTNNGQVVYNNHVRAAPSQSGEITWQVEQFLLSVTCHMEQEVMINSTITGTDRSNTSIAFYPSSSFSHPILQFPYKVRLNQDLYVQVQFRRANGSLDLLVDSCVASPDPDSQARSYTLIQNGCALDRTVYIYTNGQQSYARFRFKAFKFLRTHSYVFLQCKVIVCADSDYNSRCRQGCLMRKKRSLESSHHHTETVTLGPIARKGAESAANVEKEG